MKNELRIVSFHLRMLWHVVFVFSQSFSISLPGLLSPLSSFYWRSALYFCCFFFFTFSPFSPYSIFPFALRHLFAATSVVVMARVGQQFLIVLREKLSYASIYMVSQTPAVTPWCPLNGTQIIEGALVFVRWKHWDFHGKRGLWTAALEINIYWKGSLPSQLIVRNGNSSEKSTQVWVPLLKVSFSRSHASTIRERSILSLCTHMVTRIDRNLQ